MDLGKLIKVLVRSQNVETVPFVVFIWNLVKFYRELFGCRYVSVRIVYCFGLSMRRALVCSCDLRDFVVSAFSAKLGCSCLV